MILGFCSYSPPQWDGGRGQGSCTWLIFDHSQCQGWSTNAVLHKQTAWNPTDPSRDKISVCQGKQLISLGKVLLVERNNLLPKPCLKAEDSGWSRSFPVLEMRRNLQKHWEPPGWQGLHSHLPLPQVEGTTPSSPRPIHMAFGKTRRKMLVLQFVSFCFESRSWVVLPLARALLPAQRMCEKPTAALPHTGWAQHPLSTDPFLPPGKGLQGLIFNPEQPRAAEPPLWQSFTMNLLRFSTPQAPCIWGIGTSATEICRM